jgi:predicted alpha/beta superfamily hydrolase
MKYIILIAFFSSIDILFGQTTSSFSFHSEILNENRNIRIHLPKSFDTSTNVHYPLTLALDGEYLFYSILGVSEVLTTRQIVPESIVVGIDQNYIIEEPYSARWFDCSYDYKTGKLKEKGIIFKTFIEEELLPFLTQTYKVGKFKTIAGHSFTANYINYFLDDSVFSGFIAISPYIPNSSEDYVTKSIANTTTSKYYFLCTGENDLSGHIPQIKRQHDAIFSQSKNPNFKYAFKNYEDESHMSLTVRSISDALSLMYSDFSPIYALNLESELSKEKDLISYLIKRYENIESTYGLSIPFREDDLVSISWLIEKQKNWDQLKQLGEMEVELYPESVYGYYTIAIAEEKKRNFSVALENYKIGYSKLGDDVTNKSDFYSDIERVEKLMNKKK